MNYLNYYLIFINGIAFILYGVDKYKAIKGSDRISEAHLLSLGVLGGMIGSLMGMMFFHHKTRKIRFYIWNFSMLILWILIVSNI